MAEPKTKLADFHVAIRHFIKHLRYRVGNACTLEEIAEIKAKQQVEALPELYMAFLLAVGKSDKPMRMGYLYPEVLEFKNLAQMLLARYNPDMTLPNDAFVFVAYGSIDNPYWYFQYFLTSGHPIDPDVYEMRDTYTSPQLSKRQDRSFAVSDHQQHLLHTFSSTFIPVRIDGGDPKSRFEDNQWITRIKKLHNITIPKALEAN